MGSGKLITFEGIEGCGKTTQRDMLANYLEGKDFKVLRLREPGGVEISEKIRKVILDPETKSEMYNLTELLLFSAARTQFTKEKLRPALKSGKVILQDRYYDSTNAYQGYGLGINLDVIDFLNKIATMGIRPNITFFLDIPVELGLAKTIKAEFGKKDRIERKSLNYHQKVREGYLEIAQKEPERVKVIPYAENSPDMVHKEIVKYVDEILNQGKKWQKSLQEIVN